jgi:DNA-binding GntR family transcriptional regulator
MNRSNGNILLSDLKLNPLGSEQLHVQIQKQIREKIRMHRLPAGERLPTNHELSIALNVSYETVHRAMTALANHGVIVRRQRKGTKPPDHRDFLYASGLRSQVIPIHLASGPSFVRHVA